MPVSICTQKEFLIESKLNGFWGVLLLLLDLEIFIWEVKGPVVVFGDGFCGRV